MMEGHDMDEATCPQCHCSTVRGMVHNYGKCSLCLRDEYLAGKHREGNR